MIKKPLVEAQNIFFEKAGRAILSSVNMTLNEGDIVIVKGKNGSGKTSFLKCLAGFYRISKGQVLWSGEKILPTCFPEKKMLAWLSHLNAVKLSLTVKENLLFYANLWSVKKNEYDYAIKYLCFSKYLELPVSWLSAGEKRRLCLARLMFCPSKVWLIDEPTTFLDEENKKIFERAMEEHASKGGAIVCASHDSLNINKFKTLSLD